MKRKTSEAQNLWYMRPVLRETYDAEHILHTRACGITMVLTHAGPET